MYDISELDKRYNYLYYNNNQIMLTDYTIYFCPICFRWANSQYSILSQGKKKKDLFSQTFSISQHLPSLHSIHGAKLIPEISAGLPWLRKGFQILTDL